MDCVIEPEVALIVTCDVPTGVDGTKTSLVLEHPAIKPAEKMRAPNRPRTRKERCWLGDRRLACGLTLLSLYARQKVAGIVPEAEEYRVRPSTVVRNCHGGVI